MDYTSSPTAASTALANDIEARDVFAAQGGSPEWFADPVEKALAWASMKLHSAGEPVDIVTVGQLIAQTPKVLAAVGGNLFQIVELFRLHVTTAHFRWHMEETREAWRSRETRRLLLAEGETEKVDPGAIARKLEDLADASTQNTLQDAKTACHHFCDHLELEHELLKAGKIIETGISRLDTYTGGLKPEYWVIGARPSVGKTSFALSLINRLAVDEKLPLLFASIEMSSASVIQRLVTMRSGIAYNDVVKRAGTERINHAIMDIASAPLVIEDGNISIEQLEAKARISIRRYGIRALFVDYLQFLHSTEVRKRRGDRRLEVAEISRVCKGISREHKIPVVVLAQIGRDQEKRGSKPRLSDLKEAGDIEQDADLVAFLYESKEDQDFNEENTENWRRVSCNVAKQRNGRTGHVPLLFEPNRMKFHEGGNND